MLIHEICMLVQRGSAWKFKQRQMSICLSTLYTIFDQIIYKPLNITSKMCALHNYTSLSFHFSYIHEQKWILQVEYILASSKNTVSWPSKASTSLLRGVVLGLWRVAGSHSCHYGSKVSGNHTWFSCYFWWKMVGRYIEPQPPSGRPSHPTTLRGHDRWQ